MTDNALETPALQIKALSLHQPWASLVALGIKSIETRSWSTRYRGPLAICAAKRKPRSWWSYYGEPQRGADPLLAAMVDEYRFDHLFDSWESTDGNGDWRHEWCGPLGAVVATCELVDVVPIGGPYESAPKIIVRHSAFGPLPESLVLDDRGKTTDISDQLPYGDFTSGRWAWLLDDVRPVNPPLPVKGHQGLWNLDTAELAIAEGVTS